MQEEKLEKILQNIKCGFYMTINEHKDVYQTAKQSIDENWLEIRDEIENDTDKMNKIIELNNIIRIQFYPDTPVGFYVVYHYDLEKALDEVLEILKAN